MRVIELLAISVFQGASLRAGELGVDREVNSVNMMDAPDIINFLKEKELLVTTAFHFKDDLNSLLVLIKEMENQGCSGLGIKTKRFLQEIPQEAIKLADELKFPLFELSVDVSLGDIVSKSLSHILDIRTNELHNAMQAHQEFTNQVMSGKGIHEILGSLSSLIDFPVALLNHRLQPIGNLNKKFDFYKHFEALMTDGHLFHHSKTTMLTFSLLENQETVTLFPVYTHKQYSFICVNGHIPFTDRSTILTIKQASNVIAFELMKENALKQNARRIQNEFFTNFINGTFTTTEEIISRGKEFKLENEQRYVCAVGKIEDEDRSITYTEYQAEQDVIYGMIEADLPHFHQKVHLFTMDDTYIMLLELKDGWKYMDEPFVSFLKDIQSKISTLFHKDLSFGISNYAQQLIDVPISYKEAKDTLYYGNLSGKKQFIEFHQPKQVPEILRMVPYDQLKKFYMDTFQGFVDQPKKDYQVLLHTLSVFLETHCQLSETANRLFVHRNTVIYRLEKCEEIIGRNIKDPEETLRLRLAFRIKALIKETSR
ncbi:PucR family transcriptional regulator ligand-binding domain-containing protein [Bacillus swezeyi]|uniref:PucR family transcriptional regulator n=1 Tax=Bacillus swezeyi TaxID=1925020 RepID=UPI002E1AFF1B|nr:PucR family transcriptional regulator ligand-binding domain-containing protein [Bacillus swezeyi]MED2978766.1 PucR family transcriptional regulator ligand-binding domain-containing protein [Bacillus swezeyi]